MNLIVPFEIGLTMGLVFALAVLSLAMSFRLLSFPDLTVEGSVPLGAAVFASLQSLGYSLATASVASVLAGAIAGSLTGVIHARLRLNRFLAGIIVVSMAYSISLRIMGASNIGLLSKRNLFDAFGQLSQLRVGGVHLGTLLFLVAIVCLAASVAFIAARSRPGLRVRLAGSNSHLAESMGISTSLALILGLGVTNALAALSGVLLASYQGFADIGMGQGVLILALASLAIGERLVPTRVLGFQAFVIVSAILGSIVYQVVLAFAVRAGLAPTDLKLATAVLVLIVVALRASREADLLLESRV